VPAGGKCSTRCSPRQQKTEPVLSPLARALGVPVVGERVVQDTTASGGRIYQYTTASGQRFCVTVPPDFDPAHRTLVPTNCPR